MRTKWTKYRLREYKRDLSSFLTSWCQDYTLILHSGARQQIHRIILHNGERHSGARQVFWQQDSSQKLPTQQPLYCTYLSSLTSVFNSQGLKFYKSVSPDPARQEWHIYQYNSKCDGLLNGSFCTDGCERAHEDFLQMKCLSFHLYRDWFSGHDCWNLRESTWSHRFYKWENEIWSQLQIFHWAQSKSGS